MPLEGLKYPGSGVESWRLAGEYHMIASLYIRSMGRAGQHGVRYYEEKTGYGWKTEAVIAADDLVPALKCRMERPPG